MFRRKPWLLWAIEFALLQVACSKLGSNSHDSLSSLHEGKKGQSNKVRLNNQIPFVGAFYRYSGPRAGGTLLDQNISSTDADTTISVGGIPCTPLNTPLTPSGSCLGTQNRDQCLCLTGASPRTGEFDIIITNSGGKSKTLKNAFTYRQSAPSTNSMSRARPFYHAIDKTEKFLIEGRDLSPKIQILVGGETCTVSDFVGRHPDNTTSLTCELGPSRTYLGRRDIVFLNPDGSGFTEYGGFIYTAPAPEIDSVH
ncbi:MAG: IPT/TIG domain-containing protein, partial [Bdellovibrionia bacterium]